MPKNPRRVRRRASSLFGQPRAHGRPATPRPSRCGCRHSSARHSVVKSRCVALPAPLSPYWTRSQLSDPRPPVPRELRAGRLRESTAPDRARRIRFAVIRARRRRSWPLRLRSRVSHLSVIPPTLFAPVLRQLRRRRCGVFRPRASRRQALPWHVPTPRRGPTRTPLVCRKPGARRRKGHSDRRGRYRHDRACVEPRGPKRRRGASATDRMTNQQRTIRVTSEAAAAPKP